MRGKTCMKCGSTRIEMLQSDEYACKACRTYYSLRDITDEEMIEWFVN